MSLIWPFKRDPLESSAALLVGAVNTLATSAFLKFADEFPFLPNDKNDREYWDFIVTTAGVFIGLMGLRNLNLKAKRRLKLEKRVAACLVLMYPAIARPAFEKCKSFYDKAYDVLLNAGDEPVVRADAIGSWVAWEVLRHPAQTEQERRMARIVGLMVIHSFFNWWEKDSVQRPAR